MNATISNGGKVHRIIDGFARCGVGRNAKTRAWQLDQVPGPSAKASRSAQRTRNDPGSTSTRSSFPALIILQSVERETPSRAAAAPIPKRSGPVGFDGVLGSVPANA